MTAVSVSKHCGKPLNRLCGWHHCIRIVMQYPKCDAPMHFMLSCFALTPDHTCPPQTKMRGLRCGDLDEQYYRPPRPIQSHIFSPQS